MTATATTGKHRAFGATAAAVALLVVSACGSGGSDGGDVASAGDDIASAGGDANPAATDNAEDNEPPDADAQALAFAECMRAEGVDMPDPAPGQRGVVEAFQHGAEGLDPVAVEEAFAECDEFLPQFEHGDDHQREREEMILAIAECMREQGLDVPDDLGGLQEHRGTDAEFDAALETCRNEIVGGGQ